MRPEVLIEELIRIAPKQIISVPNFGHYSNRVELLTKGRMPQRMPYGYQWYSTGHVHQLSVKDFYDLIAATGGTRVIRSGALPLLFLGERFIGARFPNLFRRLPIFLLAR